MADYENPVAGIDMPEMPADDAQAAGITAEELLMSITDENGDETAVNEGDGGPEATESEETESGAKGKFDARIKAALASQRKKYGRDVEFAGRLRGIADGMTDDEIAEALTVHQARKMHESDAEISEKAAKEIIRARQSGDAARQRQIETYKTGIKSLMDDGWSADELREFSEDAGVKQDLADGRTIRQAAMAFMRRGRSSEPQSGEENRHKRGVPTVTKSAAGNIGRDKIAEMSDAEFDKFRRKAMERTVAGEKIRL